MIYHYILHIDLSPINTIIGTVLVKLHNLYEHVVQQVGMIGMIETS